jgi:hypothetical protein
MDAVRTDAARGSLGAAARAVATVASQFNTEAYKALHSGTESMEAAGPAAKRTEVLAALWLDLATAYEG